MRDQKILLRAEVLALKKQRSSIIADLKEEEQLYFETETARRRLEEQHGATSDLARLTNAVDPADHSATSSSSTFHASSNALHAIRRHEGLERCLIEAERASSTLLSAADALGKSV